MFSGLKINYAIEHVISKLVQFDVIQKTHEQPMKDIAKNSSNKLYGVGLLDQGAAKCKYSAVAAVFARIATYYEKNPVNGLTSQEWLLASHFAIVLAGSSADDATIMVEELMEMNRKINTKPLFWTQNKRDKG